MRAVRTGRQALPHHPPHPGPHYSLSCLVLGGWFQRPAWDSDGGKGRDLSNLFSLGAAPASAPQNLHAIRTDSGLILQWEEVIPEGPWEGPLGPYKLSWVQDNGTQVRGIQKPPLSRCPRVSPQGSKAFRALEWLSLRGLGALVGWMSHHQGVHSSSPCPAGCTPYWIMSPVRIVSSGLFVCKAGSTFLHRLGEGTDKAFLSQPCSLPSPLHPGLSLICVQERPLQPGAGM